MAITFRLKYNGNTYNFVNSGVFSGATYYPQSPDVTVNEVIDNLKNGSEITSITRRNVRETATVMMEGAASSILDKVREIELALDMASREDVYIEYCPSGDAYRSKIISGSVDWSDRAKLRSLQSSTVKSEIKITWNREWFWESTVEEQLTLTSSTDTDQTSVALDNWNGSWISIGSGDVEGAIPAPARIKIQNDMGETRVYRWVWMANNIWNDQANYQPHIDISQTDNWTGSTSHSTNRTEYTFGNAKCADMAGDYFRLLWHGFAPDNCYMQAHVAIVNGSLYARRIDGPEISTGPIFGMLDLGVFPLPPGGATGYTGITISVRYEGTSSITTDGIILLPVANSRRLNMTAYDVDDGQGVEDNGPKGTYYFYDGSGIKAPYINAYENPIYLVPNRDQKLWIYIGENGGFDEDLEKTVSIWYRPRRLTM